MCILYNSSDVHTVQLLLLSGSWRITVNTPHLPQMVKPSVHTLLLTYTQAWAVNPGAVASFHEFYEKLKVRSTRPHI